MNEREILVNGNGNGKKISEMWEEIVTKYPDKVIAIENGEVVGAAKTATELIKTLEAEKRDISRITIISVPPSNVAYIL